VDVASLAVIVTGQPLAPDAVVVLVVGVLLADAVALIAWWFGVRWAIGIQALTTAGVWLASLVAYPEGMATAGVQLLLAAAYVFLGAVAFVSGPQLTVVADEAAARDDDLPLPVRLWLAVAAVLYPFLLLPASGFGTSDFCRDCIPHTAVDDAL